MVLLLIQLMNIFVPKVLDAEEGAWWCTVLLKKIQSILLVELQRDRRLNVSYVLRRWKLGTLSRG